MDDLDARSMFLFGRETPPDDIGELFPLPDDVGVDGRDAAAPAWELLRRSVAEQVLSDTPPEAWATAQRLLATGLDRHAVLDQLARGMFYGIADEVLRHGEPDGRATITARLAGFLDRLPLPDEGEVRDALVGVVAGEQGIDAERLVRRAVADLGRDEDDGLASAEARLLLNRLVDQGDVLATLTGRRVVNRPALTSSVVLTHRLTAVEIDSGELRRVSSDLCLFADAVDPVLGEGEALDPVDAEDGLAWAGPPGWLAAFSAGELVAVRCGLGANEEQRVVTVARVGDADVVVDAGLAGALGQAFGNEVERDGAAVPIGAVVAHVAIDHPDAFRTLQAPITELAAAAGIELRGAYAGSEPEHWLRFREQQRHERLHDRCDDDDSVHAAVDLLADLEGDDADADAIRASLRELWSDDVLADLVLDELAPPDGSDDDDAAGPMGRAAVADHLLAAARRADDVAVARWIAGVIAERDGDVVAAETHLRAGHLADPDFEPLADRCAWYASDRGDAQAAFRLWSSLAEPPADELGTVAPFATPTGRRLGRNEPCWCGSGRKYKVCHQRQPERVPLPDRVGWLCRKATSYLMRHGGSAKFAVVGNVVALAGGDDDAMLTTVARDPLVTDVALHEGGWFERFLAARGPLLPDDEQLLASSWLLVERTVYEIISVDPGHGLGVRDVRTGDELAVVERALSSNVRAGSLLCARAVPDGAGHQFVGGVFPVAVGQEATLLELCDRRDPIELCSYVGATRRHPELRTREGEEMVECEAVLHVADPSATAAVLDEVYERREHDWVEQFDLNADESIVRATLHLDGSRLSVLTHSTERIDRVLATLRDALPGIELLTDERRPVEPGELPQRMPGTGAAMGASTSTALSPTQRKEFIATMERRWLNEAVPALGGLTPLEAAADPTRRPQLARLIDSFPELDDGPLMTMRPARLRAALGL